MLFLTKIIRMQQTKTLILDEKRTGQKINRIAWQIYENFYREEEIILAGIFGNGKMLAEKIAAVLREISPINIVVSNIQINKKQPLSEPIHSDINGEALQNKVVVVVDDVLDTGKTLIYGVNYFLNFNVKELKTVVLVDRSHRLFPVRADFVGITLATTLQEQIMVEFNTNGEAQAYLI
jgi:pyrimidine operon attenuation protein / uracil phosphoribosyltransferase